MNTRLLFGLLLLTPTLSFGALSTDTSYFLNVEALTNITARSAVRGLTGVFTNSITLNGDTRTAWPSGATAGTVINTGASTVGAVPAYTDLTGTNVAPSTLKVTGTNTTFAGNISMPASSSISYAGSNVFTIQLSPASETFLGEGAGNLTVTGVQNSGFGRHALTVVSSGYNNTALGANSMEVLTTGYWNTGAGVRTLYRNISGRENTAVGVESQRENTNGNRNVSVGMKSLFSNLVGENNVAVGSEALQNSLGYYNVAVGDSALITATSASFNTAVGMNAQNFSTTGDKNASIGSYSMRFNVTGAENVAMGYRAGYGVTANSYSGNTIIGFQAGEALTTGGTNLLLGYKAGDTITTGARNVVVGYNLDVPSITGNDQLTIGNIIFGTTVDGTGTTVSSGNVGIRNPAPSSTFHVAGSRALSIATGTAFTLTATNEIYLVNVDAQTVTLPTAVGVNGRTYTVKAIAPCTTATVATTSSQLIDGATTYSLSASNKFVRVISDNASWWIIGNN